MAGKIEQAIDYIAQLDPGDKVSVRSLAQALGMSEGTAYKSIKAAEAQGLVFTRPKVGTVRINLRDAEASARSACAGRRRRWRSVCR